MRNPFKRSVDVPAEVLAAAPLEAGEKVLAGAVSGEGTWLLGTRDALLLVPASVEPSPPVESAGSMRLPWELVEHADWDRDEERLVVTEVGHYGVPRAVHRFSIEDPGLLLELLRERVSASVVLQRRVPVDGRRGLSVVARRAPRGDGAITWAYEFDRGVDPRDPAVMEAAERGLAVARQELGL